MNELGLCAVTVKKYKPHSNKKGIEGLENGLKRDFTTTSINYMTPEQCELFFIIQLVNKKNN